MNCYIAFSNISRQKYTRYSVHCCKTDEILTPFSKHTLKRNNHLHSKAGKRPVEISWWRTTLHRALCHPASSSSTNTTLSVSFATGASAKATSVSFAWLAALGHSSLHGRGNDSILICFYFSKKKNSWEANCVHSALSLGTVEVCVPSAGNIHLISHCHEHCDETAFPDHGAR